MRFHALGVPRKPVKTAVPSKFNETSFQGESQHQKRSNWCEFNLKATLGTMELGIGPSNMVQLLSFLDLPNFKTLNDRFFENMELTIGSTLRKIALESMEEATEEEVRLTINN